MTMPTNHLYAQWVSQLAALLLPIDGPAIIGITGAQGTGKSTLAARLAKQLTAQGRPTAAVSLDDYYLNRTQRQQLAKQVHPLLAQRGVPGTHRIEQALDDAHNFLQGKAVAWPHFDKALDEPGSPCSPQKAELLLVEGWCLGLAPQSDQALQQPINALEHQQDADGRWRRYVNQQLTAAYADYWQLLKPLIWLQAPDWQTVCRWRQKQEQQLWQQRGMGMSKAQLAQFMLSFERLTLASWQQLPSRADLQIQLDHQQQPITTVIINSW
ncbi:kinase [Alkalimonas delamerensis]|uniref:Kinase n=1 Tax=Alkalimonas delamerensis TaxID=265981 RepID=A0ABT9GSR0_9GAMM|nr:kinase [Alkalimonas delamerensis]MDP4530015.1 kinase [Alkalimonas delamerensis]